MRINLTAMALALALAPIAPAYSDEQAETANVEAPPVDRWVSELDDNQYDSRQRAQKKLENTGLPALSAVATAAESGSLERTTRAVNVLLKWSEGKDQALRFAALEKLANLPNRPRESAMAARLLASARERAALAALVRLGAKYRVDRRLRGIDNLQVVLGPQWEGGIDGIKHLADIPRAATVSLHAAPVGKEMLDKLATFPQVQLIEVYSTGIAKADSDAFKQQHPNIEVDYRQALLGVEGSQFGKATINGVQPNSAAAKAGIRRGDHIVQLNGEKVASFEDLTEKIRPFKPGESAQLTIVRGAETLEVKVTFDDWRNTDVTKTADNLPPTRIQQQIPNWQLPPPAQRVPQVVPRQR